MVPAHTPRAEHCQVREPAFFKPDGPGVTCKSRLRKSRLALPEWAVNLRKKETKQELSCPLLTALISRTAASPPGHSEQREPPQPADAARLGPEQRRPGRPAQVAAVHPVQNGPGGDPVLRSGLTVLPSLRGLLGSQCQHSGLAIMGLKNKTLRSKQVGEHTGTVHSLSSLVHDVQRPGGPPTKLSCYTYF